MSQGLKDTRELSHAALEVRVREFLQHTEVVAHELSGLPDFDLITTLDRERRDSAALEFTVVGAPDADHRHELRSAHGYAARHRPPTR